MNRKKLFLLSIFCSSIFSLMGQDLIVTQDNDSLNVEIIRVDEEFIHFISFQPKKQRHSIAKEQVKTFQYIFYSENRINNYFFDPNDTRFRLAISGGASIVFQGADDNATNFFKNYVRSVNSGWHFKVESAIYHQSNLGFGIVWDRYLTSGYEPNVEFRSENDTIVGVLSDKIKIDFLGPQFSYNIDTKIPNFTAFIGGGAGFINYKDELKRVYPYVAKGSTFGVHLSGGLDFVISDNFTMGFEVSGTFGALPKYEIKSDTEVFVIEEKEDISRINISIGLRYFR